MSVNRYAAIANGYFYNIPIKCKEIKAPIIITHSNQNCFITINNINPLFSHLNSTKLTSKIIQNNNDDNKGNNYFNTASNILNISSNNFSKRTSKYNFDELKTDNSVKRKLIVVEGSHDIITEDKHEILEIIYAYFQHLFSKKISL